MTGDSSSWIYLDLQAGPVSPALRLSSEGGEEGPTTVMIMATEAVREKGWAAQATLHLVREWTRVGARIFLMDLHLDAPELHSFLDHENREGVSDVILYGASVPRVSRAVDGGSFYLATAGTAVADPTEVLAHSRWTEVIQGFREAGVTLVLYCPHELLETSPLTGAAEVRVLLRGPWEEDVELDPKGPTPTAVAGPGWEAPESTRSKAPEGLSPDAVDDVEESESSSWGELDLDDALPGDQREVEPEGSALHGEEFRSLDVSTPQSPEGTEPAGDPVGPVDPGASEEPGLPDDAGAPGSQGEMGAGSPEPGAPRMPTAPIPRGETELQRGAEEADAGFSGEVPHPPEPAPARSVAPGKPREVAGTGRGGAVRTILMVILLLLVGVLLADYLGYLDLSSVVDLPWHEASDATARLLGQPTE